MIYRNLINEEFSEIKRKSVFFLNLYEYEKLISFCFDRFFFNVFGGKVCDMIDLIYDLVFSILKLDFFFFNKKELNFIFFKFCVLYCFKGINGFFF